MYMQLRLSLLGKVCVEWSGHPIRNQDFGSRKDLALLCYLAVEGGIVPRYQLATLFWHNKTEKQGLNNLNRVLSQIRKLLPGCLVTDQYNVGLNPEVGLWLDTLEFGGLENERTPESLALAASLYQSEFMSGFILDGGFEFETWLEIQREKWAQKIVNVLRQLVDYYIYYEDKHFERGLAFATKLLEIQPWRESAHRQKMRILARSGQFSAALMQFKLCRRVLAQELNVTPSHETLELVERIRHARTNSKHNVPQTLTPIVGRKTEMLTLSRWLSNKQYRLITVTGLGGVGKTRVVLELAHAKVGLFLHGVYFVELVGIFQPEQFLYVLANTLNIPLQTGLSPIKAITRYLAKKDILLVLDNFDELIHESTLKYLQMLLMASYNLKIVITSRQRLKLPSEHILTIQGLPVVDGKQSGKKLVGTSSELFLQTAQRNQIDFAPNSKDIESITTICKCLSGNPLAIELAATWIRTTSCQQIAQEIENDLLFLGQSLLGAENIQMALDYSWQRLTEQEKRVFCQLSVFQGGFSRQAVHYVTHSSLATLTSLVDKSLLQWHSVSRRYEYHELVRRYAELKLSQDRELKIEAELRHFYFYTDLIFSTQQDIPPTFSRDIGNIQRAWANGLRNGHAEIVERSLSVALNLACHNQIFDLILATLLTRVMLWYKEGQRKVHPWQNFLHYVQHHVSSHQETRLQAKRLILSHGMTYDHSGLDTHYELGMLSADFLQRKI